jgi:hypothetical protein
MATHRRGTVGEAAVLVGVPHVPRDSPVHFRLDGADLLLMSAQATGYRSSSLRVPLAYVKAHSFSEQQTSRTLNYLEIDCLAGGRQLHMVFTPLLGGGDLSHLATRINLAALNFRAAQPVQPMAPLEELRRRLDYLRPQALVGDWRALPSAVGFAVLLALPFLVDVLNPGLVTVGALSVLPVLAAAWLLPADLSLIIAVLAMTLRALAVLTGHQHPLTAAATIITLLLITPAARSAAVSLASMLHTLDEGAEARRRNPYPELLGALARMGPQSLARSRRGALLTAACFVTVEVVFFGDILTPLIVSFGALSVVPLVLAGWFLSGLIAATVTALACVLFLVSAMAGQLEPATASAFIITCVLVGLLSHMAAVRVAALSVGLRQAELARELGGLALHYTGRRLFELAARQMVVRGMSGAALAQLENTAELRLVASHLSLEADAVEVVEKSIAAAALEDRPVLVRDLEGAAETGAPRSLVAVPLRRDGRPYGVLARLALAARAFDDRDVEALNQLALALSGNQVSAGPAPTTDRRVAVDGGSVLQG